MKKIILVTVICILASCASITQQRKAEITAIPEIESTKIEKNQSADTSDINVVIETKEDKQRPRVQSLTNLQIDNLVKRAAAAGTVPVCKNGRLLSILYDLDKNGYEDIFVLCINDDSDLEADVKELSNLSRLFTEDHLPITYSLQIFFQTEGKLILKYHLPIGRKLVLDSFKQVEIKKGSTKPFAVSAAFKTTEGTEEEWFIFINTYVSRFYIQESLSVVPVIEDIDNNGFLDIVIHEKGFEEGIGYETYLTWYKWDGKNYKENKSTNIVRNLKKFFRKSEIYILSSDWKAFVEYGVAKKDLDNLRNRGLTDYQIYLKVFSFVKSKEGYSFEPLKKVDELTSVVFPEILETPFTSRDKRYFNFSISVRFECVDNQDHLYTARIFMHKNPFIQPQFSYYVN